MTFKICTIGCGSLASRVHGPSYRKYAQDYSDTMLAACCDLDAKKAQAFQEKFGFHKHYTDFKEMLRAEQPDAVCLVVPEPLTAAMSVQVMELGFPLMMEKPPGLSREEAISMIDASDRYSVPHQVALNRWHVPIALEAKVLIRSQVAKEDIHFIRYDFSRLHRVEHDFETTAIHGISGAAFWADSPYRYVRFHYQELPHLGDKVSNIFMHCEFESGAVAHINFTPVSGISIERATVQALGHTFFMELPIWSAYDHPGRLVHVHGGEVKLDRSGEEISGSEELFITNGFYAENESFFNDIRGGRKPQCDTRAALQFVELADCIRLRKTEYVRGDYQ
ncbi:Gfo/Idh/MocA family protein [Paenibacillus cremeus]|uniref:Gfo/Idh/MocA family protein n=1 Tax=Paenibacillus cremeus TaxID=2163881 RepID=UPI0016494203|nr:Gfo/Idh/MocA family oxidoreductase [Paenibacillus cremeus]